MKVFHSVTDSSGGRTTQMLDFSKSTDTTLNKPRLVRRINVIDGFDVIVTCRTAAVTEHLKQNHPQRLDPHWIWWCGEMLQVGAAVLVSLRGPYVTCFRNQSSLSRL